MKPIDELLNSMNEFIRTYLAMKTCNDKIKAEWLRNASIAFFEDIKLKLKSTTFNKEEIKKINVELFSLERVNQTYGGLDEVIQTIKEELAK